MKDFFRKHLVNLKRRPQTIPLILLVVSCVIYTFHLTVHSNAAMYVSSQIIALYVFIITLASMLVIFSFMNAYARGTKHFKLMMGVVFLLLAVQIILDIVYLNIMFHETMVRDNPVPITQDIADSMNWTMIHLAVLALALLSIVLLPVYRRLLQKIDTSIEDEEFDDLQAESLVEEEEEDELLED